jgi:hypothetical protein
MKTLLGSSAAVVSDLGLVRLSNRFRHHSLVCSAFVPDRYNLVLSSHGEFSTVMPSVPLNAGDKERNLSCGTLE